MAKGNPSRTPLGVMIALLLGGAFVGLAIHEPDNGPHVFTEVAQDTTPTTPTTDFIVRTTTTFVEGPTTTTIAGATTSTVPGGTTTTVTTPVAPTALAGKNGFVVVSATKDGADVPIQSQLVLKFKADGKSASWTDGCSTASAPVVIRANKIEVGEVASPSVQCFAAPPEDTYLITPVMRSNPNWANEGGRFVFTGGGIRLVTEEF